MTSTADNGLLIIERILRDRASVWRQIVEERDLRPLILQMLVSSLVSLALYGAVLGASFGWNQALSSFIKLPLLFLATLAICLPTLYLFNLVFGARLSMLQAVALIMVSITVTAVLTLAFAPISLFFLITAQSYSFFKLLNVAILILTAAVGLRFMTAGMQALNERAEAQTANAELPHAGAEFDHVELAATRPAWDGLPAGAPQPVSVLTALNHAVSGTVPLPAAPVSPAPVSFAPVSPVPAGAEPASIPVQPGQGVPGRSAQLPAASMQGAPQPYPMGMVPGMATAPGQPMQPYPMQPFPVQAPHPLPDPGAREGRPGSMTLLYIWILLFGFVGTQLAWTLRPFFGSPGEPFGLFRQVGGTFYGDILNTIGTLLGVD